MRCLVCGQECLPQRNNSALAARHEDGMGRTCYAGWGTRLDVDADLGEVVA